MNGQICKFRKPLAALHKGDRIRQYSWKNHHACEWVHRSHDRLMQNGKDIKHDAVWLYRHTKALNAAELADEPSVCTGLTCVAASTRVLVLPVPVTHNTRGTVSSYDT
jgi:hypothetical protein